MCTVKKYFHLDVEDRIQKYAPSFIPFKHFHFQNVVLKAFTYGGVLNVNPGFCNVNNTLAISIIVSCCTTNPFLPYPVMTCLFTYPSSALQPVQEVHPVLLAYLSPSAILKRHTLQYYTLLNSQSYLNVDMLTLHETEVMQWH